jgi:hypothetical protein
MTAVLDNLSTTVERLIETCQRSQRSFKAAADAARSDDLRRLLNLYSHQRTRFAGELKAHCALEDFSTATISENDSDGFSGKSDEEILEHCLAEDSNCLQAYAQALSARIPGRAQFLIAAQYSLMQQVHARMRSMAAKSAQTKVTSISHCYET